MGWESLRVYLIESLIWTTDLNMHILLTLFRTLTARPKQPPCIDIPARVTFNRARSGPTRFIVVINLNTPVRLNSF